VPVARGRPGARIGFVPQLGVRDPEFPLTVEQVVLQGLSPSLVGPPIVGAEARGAARTLLDRLGLGDLGSRPIGHLSGGQLQRAFLARAMIGRRGLIFLDEPTSGVDLASRRDILHLLGELNDDGLTIVLTTHDLNWVAAHLPRIVCLNRVVVADGPPRTVLTPEILERAYGTETVVLEQGGRVLIADAVDILPSEAAARGSAPPGSPS
jgi:zinc/manganese transport system ATP-binding protein